MAANENLFIAPEDLYRIGNSSSPRMDDVRARDVSTYMQDGIEIVIANGRGISLYNKKGLQKSPLSGWAWQINAGTSFPMGLTLTQDDDPEGHYTLVPQFNMPLSKFKGLLEEVALNCTKVFKKSAAG